MLVPSTIFFSGTKEKKWATFYEYSPTSEF